MGTVANTYIDTFFVKNRTNNVVTLGDLVNISIGGKRKVDLLTYPRVSKEKINQSTSLQEAIAAGILKVVDVDCKRKNTNKSNKQAILASLADIRDVTRIKGVHVTNPVATDIVPIWKTEQNITITKIVAIVDAGNVIFDVDHTGGSSPFSVGTLVLDDIIVDTDGVVLTSFEDANVDTGRWVVYRPSTISGSPERFNIQIEYDERCVV